MEKRKPTYRLDDFKISMAEDLRITITALNTASQLGWGKTDIVQCIQTMQRTMFFKSMTSYANHQIWQDVYHVPAIIDDEPITLYVKFTGSVIIDISTEYTVLSFKEK